MVYLFIDTNTQAVSWGLMNINLTHEIYFSFKAATGITFAVNIIAVAVGISFFNFYRNGKVVSMQLASNQSLVKE